MERYFKIDKFNTFIDWDLILTAKDITPPEPKIYNVDIDGMDGSLDLTEALTGGVVYNNRTITAEFWTDHGKRSDRVKLLDTIRQAIHGKKVTIVEPDDPGHYFIGRIAIKAESNNLAFATISIECDCEPYKYALEDTTRTIVVNGVEPKDLVINNTGRKTIIPELIVDGSITVNFDGYSTSLTDGTYKIAELKLRNGFNTINISGTGSIMFKYKEACL